MYYNIQLLLKIIEDERCYQIFCKHQQNQINSGKYCRQICIANKRRLCKKLVVCGKGRTKM